MRNQELTLTERYIRWVVRWRRVVLPAALVAALLAAAGIRKLGFIDEYRIFFSPDNPQLLAFDEVEAIYTKNDNILMVVVPPNGNAFSNGALAVIEDLTAEAWKIPFAIRVDSLSNFQYTRAEGEDELIVEDFVTDAGELGPAELELKRQIALAELLLRSRLVPPETNVAGINVTLQLPGKERDETARAVAFARDLGRRIEQDHPGFETHLTGMVMLNNAFQESAMKDMKTLTPLMFLVIIVVMAVLLRSVSATLATMAVIGLSVVVALGLAGWAGLSLTPPSTASVTMIMTLAVADSIHILVSMLGEFVMARRHALLCGRAAAALLLVALVPMNELNDQFVTYLDRSTDFRQAWDFARVRFLSPQHQFQGATGVKYPHLPVPVHLLSGRFDEQLRLSGSRISRSASG